MKKSKLPPKQWKMPEETELFDHLPQKQAYNFEGLDEKRELENFRECYMQALVSHFNGHPVGGHVKNETYYSMFDRDEDYQKDLGRALTSVVEPYVEGKKPICAFPEYKIDYLTRTIETGGDDSYTRTQHVYFSADSIPMSEKAQQAAQAIRHSYAQTRHKTDDWGSKRVGAVMGVVVFGVLTAILAPMGVTLITKGSDALWFMAILPGFIKLLAAIPVLLLGTVGALVCAGLLIYNLWLMFYRFTTDPKALQADFCRIFAENATTYYRWVTFFHYWKYKRRRTDQDFEKWKEYYEQLYQQEHKGKTSG